jgi:hypothetical protein
VENEPVAGIVPDEFARREMVLEIDDHSEVPAFAGDFYPLATGAARGSIR